MLLLGRIQCTCTNPSSAILVGSSSSSVDDSALSSSSLSVTADLRERKEQDQNGRFFNNYRNLHKFAGVISVVGLHFRFVKYLNTPFKRTYSLSLLTTANFLHQAHFHISVSKSDLFELYM